MEASTEAARLSGEGEGRTARLGRSTRSMTGTAEADDREDVRRWRRTRTDDDAVGTHGFMTRPREEDSQSDAQCRFRAEH